MKRSELAFSVALIPLDILAMVTAFSLAYLTRIKSGVIYVWDFPTFFRFVLGFVPFWIFLFSIEGLYRIKGPKRLVDEFAKVFLGVSSALMLVVLWIFLSRTEFFSRLVVVYALVYAILFVFGLRLIARLVQRYLLRYGIGIHRVAVVGGSAIAHQIISLIQRDRSLGFKLMKIFSRDQIDIIGRFPILNQIDEIILADPAVPESQILKLIDFCEERRIIFRMVPNLLRVHALNVDIAPIHGIPVIEFRKSPLDGWWRVSKRLVDLVLALVATVITAPLMLVIAAVVKITSPGPVLYRNKRIGPDGVFETLKFRTMQLKYCTGKEYGGDQAELYERRLIRSHNARKGGIYKIKQDPRVTPVGQLLRGWSIDELPQLFNVLRGDMSLVGPRPHQAREVKHYQSAYQKLLHVKPGLTGLAQISGRSDLNTDDEVKLDTYYVENWSLWLDIQILLRTPMAVFQKREVV